MKVAVLGFGTIGFGIYEMLGEIPGLEQGPVLVREGKADTDYKVTSIDAILGDSSVDAVAEAMGGIEPAYTYAKKTLESGRHFVTANKALVAARGIELAGIAREKGVAFLFSASCGGGVPFLHNLYLTARTDTVKSVSGILNGTTNYMLDAMQRRHWEYAEALKEAQKLGYAEADPTADVSGMDALRKIRLACAVAFSRLPDTGNACEGIVSLTAADVAQFQALGRSCRLIASGGPAGDSVYSYVEPVLFPSSAPECSVLENYNMASYNGNRCGSMVFMGQGAGRFPTASAVLRDICDICAGVREMLPAACVTVTPDNSGDVHSYYVRLPSSLVRELPVKKILFSGDVTYLITTPMAVQDMHDKINELRKDGTSIFFAAWKE